jgi:hypothetical protein
MTFCRAGCAILRPRGACKNSCGSLRRRYTSFHHANRKELADFCFSGSNFPAVPGQISRSS